MQPLLMQMLPGLLTALITAIVGALGGYLAGRIQREGKKDKAMEAGVKGLLRAQILTTALRYLDDGAIPPFGMETLRGLLEPYEALGDGDPSIKIIVGKCEQLPVCSGHD